MKCKKISINEKDIAILNKVKKFLNTPNSDIEDKDIAEFNRTIKWINRWFTCVEQNKCCDGPEPADEIIPQLHKKHQKMGHGMIRGLSGLNWDLSKMTEDEAREFKAHIERDKAHDRMMHPWKYMKNRPIKRPEDYGFDQTCYCHEHRDNQEAIDEIVDQILDLVQELVAKKQKSDDKNNWLPILSILIGILKDSKKKED